MKTKFLYFEDYDNKTRYEIGYIPGYFWRQEYEDLILKCEIIKSKLYLTLVDDGHLNKKDIAEINKELKRGLTDSWEFVDFYKTEKMNTGEDTLGLVSNEMSKTGKKLLSKQNMENVNKIGDILNKQK